MKLTITGYSTALFSTWYFIEELGILFDVGDGVMSALLQKSRKVKNIFISHADRDHITGLLQFNQLNAREGFPVIHYPKDSGSFPAMENFFAKFDPHMNGAVWKSIGDSDVFIVKDNISVKAIRNGHVDCGEKIQKSMSFQVFQTKSKLKPELSHLSKKEIAALVRQEGKGNITEEITENILAYSGDTPVENYDRWKDAGILIHEATFLNDEEKMKGNKHSKLADVMDMVKNSNVQALILGHFSSRYDKEEIQIAVKNLCKEHQLNIPVYCVMPGMIHRDILGSTPVNDKSLL